MNERVPDSSGLPLRAMVMVLLFLGVIFLLVGFQAMSSSNDSGEDTSTRTLTTTSKPAAPKPDVRV
ncbi:MAG: LytR C-terminal domain-containing protein, partial [Mycobacterium sp.]